MDQVKEASPSAARAALPTRAREAMEKLNADAGKLNIWLRTQANAPAQRPWFRDAELDAAGAVASGRVGAGQLKTTPYRWRWREISPYLHKIAEVAKNADVPPVEFADRQQFLLTNPGLGGRLQVANASALIPLKSKAWLDLTRRKSAGESIDSRNVAKHRNDIFRLAATLPGYLVPRLVREEPGAKGKTPLR